MNILQMEQFIKILGKTILILQAFTGLQHPQIPLGGIIDIPSLTIEQRLINKTAQEKSLIKSQEIAKLDLRGQYIDPIYKVKVEITSPIKQITINEISGIEFYAKGWKGTNQLGFGKDGSVEIERFRIFNPPILVPNPQGTIIRTWKDAEGNTQTRVLKEDPAAAIRETLAHTILVSGKESNNIVFGKIGNTTSTFYPAAGTNSPVDGYSRNDPASPQAWATIRGAADGNAASDTDTDHYLGHLGWDTAGPNWSQIWRSFTLFDTSAIGSGQQVDSATLSFVVRFKRNNTGINNTARLDVRVSSSTPASNAAIAAADYDQVGSTSFCSTNIAYDTVNTDNATYNDCPFNSSGLAAVNMTGISKFGQRGEADLTNTEPAGMNVTGASDIIGISADTVGTAKDPKLVVNYSVAAAAIPKKANIIIFE